MVADVGPRGIAPEFVAAVSEAETSEAVMAVLVRYIGPFGMDCVAIGELPSQGNSRLSPFFHTTWPKSWFELYVEHGLVAEDAIFAKAREATLPFTWSEIAEELNTVDSGRSDFGLMDLVREHGWTDGLVVPIHGPDNYHGLVSYAGAPKVLGVEERTVLHIMGLHAHDRLLSLRERDPEGRRQIAAESAGLTAREIEAIHLLATGLTDKEMALRFGVAERTCLHYIQSARRKLGCRTRAQLIAEAIRLGILP